MRRNDLCAMFLGGAVLAFSGCASSPIEESSDLKELPRLPKVVFVKVEPDKEGLFGTRDDWVREISRVFEGLGVCAAVWTEENGEENKADMVVSLAIAERADRTAPDVDGNGAFLDFLAWSTVPLLPLWIPDVNIDPGIEAEVHLLPVPPLPGGAELVRGEIPGRGHDPSCKQVKSCQMERHPLLSWSTLGGIFVPPFVFDEPDRAHFAASVSDRVRAEVACNVAWMVKGCRPPGGKELLREPKLESQKQIFSCEADPELLTIEWWIEKGLPGERDKTNSEHFDWPAGSRLQLHLEGLTPDLLRDAHLLRIEATDRRGLTWRYSLPVRAEGGLHAGL